MAYQTSLFRLLKFPIFTFSSAFLNFQGPLAKIVRKLGFQKKSSTNDSQNKYLKAKRNSLKENLQQPTQPTQN